MNVFTVTLPPDLGQVKTEMKKYIKPKEAANVSFKMDTVGGANGETNEDEDVDKFNSPLYDNLVLIKRIFVCNIAWLCLSVLTFKLLTITWL